MFFSICIGPHVNSEWMGKGEGSVCVGVGVGGAVATCYCLAPSVCMTIAHASSGMPDKLCFFY